MAFNAIDGMMAKEHGQASAAGAVLNELSDVIADAALYLPFALIPGLNAAAGGAGGGDRHHRRDGGRARSDDRRAAPL